MQQNSTFKKMSTICKKYGYFLNDACQRKWNSRPNSVEIHITPLSRDYHPEIYYSSPFMSKSTTQDFEIGTTSYGTLKTSEYEKFLKGVQDAYNLVIELKKIDFSTLEVLPDDLD